MLDKIKKIKINQFIDKPLSELSLKFIQELSQALRREKNINKYPELIYLILWCSKKRILDYKNSIEQKQHRLGRGIVFHVCASNSPTNFVYSFLFGLLSGNSNIVKIPSKNTPEKKIILKVINNIFRKKIFTKLRNSNIFIQYKNEKEITEQICSLSDARVVWGSDNTINKLREFKTNERCIDITFPDRYSISVINIDKLNKLKVPNLAQKFFFDGFTMNQAACNSPHHLFWIGKKNKKIQKFFLKKLKKVVEKKFSFDEKHISDKYLNLFENILLEKKVKDIQFFENKIYVINSESFNDNIEDIRGKNGTFFEKNLSSINELKKFVTKKCQTMSYYGLDKKMLEKFLFTNNLMGIDRVVPIGNSIEIDLIWDGFDVIKTLSRIITIR